MRLVAAAAAVAALTAAFCTPASTATKPAGTAVRPATTTPLTTTAPTDTAATDTATAPAPGRARQAAPTKVLTIVEENHSYAQMRSQMPYLFHLAKRYGYATRWTAISHPSLPNYLALVGGSTFGVTDDNNPSAHRIKGTSIFDQAIARGKTAKAYVEAMPSRCHLTNSPAYAVRHNPWTYFVDSRSRCARYDVPISALSPRSLPNAGMVTPNLCHDAHDCSLGVADSWLRRRLPPILASSDFTAGRLTVVVTADEDDRSSRNRVLTVVMNRVLSGLVVKTPLTHYSLTRYYAQVLGATPLRKAAKAPNMKAAFGL